MAIFKYTLPSGAQFTMNAPAGTTQAQADNIFYSQVAAGTFVGYNVGDTLTHPTEALTNFGITRLERGTAGVDDQTLVAITSGLPVVASVPSLSSVPVQNPIDQSNYIQTMSNPVQGQFSQGAPAIGQLSGPQVQSLMAQLASTVNQPSNVMTQALGVGTYGFNAQQLERAGYIKPGYSQMYCPINPSTQANPDNFIEFMNSPSPWTGRDGVVSVDKILNSQALQNQIQQTLMLQSYDTFVELGMITPSTPSTTTPVASAGYVYNNDGTLTQPTAIALATTPLGVK